MGALGVNVSECDLDNIATSCVKMNWTGGEKIVNRVRPVT